MLASITDIRTSESISVHLGQTTTSLSINRSFISIYSSTSGHHVHLLYHILDVLRCCSQKQHECTTEPITPIKSIDRTENKDIKIISYRTHDGIKHKTSRAKLCGGRREIHIHRNITREYVQHTNQNQIW